MKPPLSIRANELTRRFGAVTAIQNVSFTVKHGEIVGFLGPNGAGKSTTMRILSGILPAHSGAAWISGISVAEHPREIKRKIGYMPENNPLPGDMRVVEYLRFRARLKEVPRKNLHKAVESAMETCDLARTARRKIIGTLSKGFRQRVGIADALLGDPQVIIMDEPTIGLDPHQIQGIRKLIDSLRGRMTVILSSHILPEIERCCDRVIIINQGRVVAAGTNRELCEEFLPGNRFLIELDGSKIALQKKLNEHGLQVDILNASEAKQARQKLTLCANENIQGSQILQALYNADHCIVHSLNKSEPNLEEIFLAATRLSWEETIEMPKPIEPIDRAGGDGSSSNKSIKNQPQNKI
jgi:ABC-2 type transport system ATP-binding protein